MFNLKLIRHGSDGDYTTRISVQHFDTHIRNSQEVSNLPVGATIIPMFPNGGVEFHVGNCRPPGEPVFDVCFVENDEGKTIDRIGPFPVAAKGARGLSDSGNN